MLRKLAPGFARFHRLLALVIGVQLLAWTASGLFFTLWPIEQVRGEHLLRAEPDVWLDPATVRPLDAVTPEPVRSAHLTRVGARWCWRVDQADGAVLFDATTGSRLTPLAEATVREIIAARWAGDAPPAALTLLSDPPREWGRPGPVWQARFKGPDKARLYVHASTGEARVVRTDLWRAFDVLWRFHIMDLTGEDRFDTWWLKLAAFFGLAVAVSGMALLANRIGRGLLFR